MVRTAIEKIHFPPKHVAKSPVHGRTCSELGVSITCDRSRESPVLAAHGDAVPPLALDAPGAPGLTPPVIDAPGFLIPLVLGAWALKVFRREMSTTPPSLSDIVLSGLQVLYPRLCSLGSNTCSAATLMVGRHSNVVGFVSAVDCLQVRLAVVTLFVVFTARCTRGVDTMAFLQHHWTNHSDT